MRVFLVLAIMCAFFATIWALGKYFFIIKLNFEIINIEMPFLIKVTVLRQVKWQVVVQNARQIMNVLRERSVVQIFVMLSLVLSLIHLDQVLDINRLHVSITIFFLHIISKKRDVKIHFGCCKNMTSRKNWHRRQLLAWRNWIWSIMIWKKRITLEFFKIILSFNIIISLKIQD